MLVGVASLCWEQHKHLHTHDSLAHWPRDWVSQRWRNYTVY